MRARLTVLLTALVVLGAAPAARANVTSIGVAGTSLTVTGSTGADTPTLVYLPPASGAPGYSMVTDAGVPAATVSGPCTKTKPPTQAPAANAVWCADGGTATALTAVTLSLGAGDDQPTLNECFTTATVDLAEGTNTFAVPECTDGTLTFSSGTGKDTLNGSGTTSVNVTASLGAGDDTAFSGGGNDTLSGGPGNDYLVAQGGNDTLQGDADNDTLLGGAANDLLDGGDGDDSLDLSKGISNDPGLGADEYRGGAGTDTVYLDNHPAGMTITLDDVANDGSPNEGDNLRSDLEDIRGTAKNDFYTGSTGPDLFNGGAGDDIIHGGDGADTLFGGSDSDMVYGDGGDDTVYGDYGNDTVDGGAGRDNVFGDLANCSSAGCPAYNDTILARDGELDQIQCGGGADTAQVDLIDVVAQDALQGCESVDRPAADAPSGGTNVLAPTTAAASFGPTGKPSIAKGAKVAVTCAAACTFTVDLRLSASAAKKRGLGKKSVTIGTAKGTLLAPGAKTVTVKLTKKALAKLKKLKSQVVTIRISVRGASGKIVVPDQTATLKG